MCRIASTFFGEGIRRGWSTDCHLSDSLQIFRYRGLFFCCVHRLQMYVLGGKFIYVVQIRNGGRDDVLRSLPELNCVVVFIKNNGWCFLGSQGSSIIFQNSIVCNNYSLFIVQYSIPGIFNHSMAVACKNKRLFYKSKCQQNNQLFNSRSRDIDQRNSSNVRSYTRTTVSARKYTTATATATANATVLYSRMYCTYVHKYA